MVIKGIIVVVVTLVLRVGISVATFDEISESECYVRCHPAPAVRISDGCLCGTMMPGLDGRGSFEAFLGIPFAKPPLGKLRFANPIRNDRWKGLRNASTPSGICIQRDDFGLQPKIQGVEDCLYLNVYRPKFSGHPLPVMVFIHGGGYIAGSAHPALYGPQRFMDTGKVILVSIQYRLGVFGFLSTEDGEAPGNFGLKDQSLALRWVRRNIRKFGGYHREITIFGQSAGSSSVQLHMMSPLSRGLFSRAISQSGSALAYWGRPLFEPLDLARRHAATVGIRNADWMSSWKLVDALRRVDATELVASTTKLKIWFNEPIILYTPVVEKHVDLQTFLSRDPRELWSSGQYESVPWMTGFVSNEGAPITLGIISNPTLLGQFIDKQEAYLPLLITLNETERSALLSRFFEESPVTTQNADGMLTMVSEAGFFYPMMTSVKQFVEHQIGIRAPLTLYHFNFKGRTGFQHLYTTSTTDYGIVHGEDTLYLFQNAFLPHFPPNSPEAQMCRELVDQWVHFAYKGELNVRGSKKRSCECGAKLDQVGIVEFSNSGLAADAVKIDFLGKRSDKFKYLLDVLSWWSNKY